MQKSDFKTFGNQQLLSNKKTAFLCSRNASEGQTSVMLEWVRSLLPSSCVICGLLTSAENKVFKELLRLQIPTIAVLSDLQHKTLDDKEMQTAFDEQRLLVLTLISKQDNPNADDCYCERNELILSMADSVAVGYVRAGGNIERQIQGLHNLVFLREAKSCTVAEQSYELDSRSGKIFFDNKMEQEEQYLKITQSKRQGLLFHRNKLFIDKSELMAFRNAIDKAINFWNLNARTAEASFASSVEKSWSAEEDKRLLYLHDNGVEMKYLCQAFKRERGAISSRLKELGR